MQERPSYDTVASAAVPWLGDVNDGDLAELRIAKTVLGSIRAENLRVLIIGLPIRKQDSAIRTAIFNSGFDASGAFPCMWGMSWQGVAILPACKIRPHFDIYRSTLRAVCRNTPADLTIVIVESINSRGQHINWLKVAAPGRDHIYLKYNIGDWSLRDHPASMHHCDIFVKINAVEMRRRGSTIDWSKLYYSAMPQIQPPEPGFIGIDPMLILIAQLKAALLTTGQHILALYTLPWRGWSFVLISAEHVIVACDFDSDAKHDRTLELAVQYAISVLPVQTQPFCIVSTYMKDVRLLTAEIDGCSTTDYLQGRHDGVFPLVYRESIHDPIDCWSGEWINSCAYALAKVAATRMTWGALPIWPPRVWF